MVTVLTPVNIGGSNGVTYSARFEITDANGSSFNGGSNVGNDRNVPADFSVNETTGQVTGEFKRTNPAFANPPVSMTIYLTAENEGGTSTAAASIQVADLVAPQLEVIADQLDMPLDNTLKRIQVGLANTAQDVSYSQSGLPVDDWYLDPVSGTIVGALNSSISQRTVTVNATNSSGTDSVTFQLSVATGSSSTPVAPNLQNFLPELSFGHRVQDWPQLVRLNLLSGTEPVTWSATNLATSNGWQIDTSTGILTIPQPGQGIGILRTLDVTATNAQGADTAQLQIFASQDPGDIGTYAIKSPGGLGQIPTGWSRDALLPEIDFSTAADSLFIPALTGSAWGRNVLIGPRWDTLNSYNITVRVGPDTDQAAAGLCAAPTTWQSHPQQGNVMMLRNAAFFSPNETLSYSSAVADGEYLKLEVVRTGLTIEVKVYKLPGDVLLISRTYFNVNINNWSQARTVLDAKSSGIDFFELVN